MGDVAITIDGRPVTAGLHEMAIRVAERSGITIPTLCDHPDLEPYGACRICLVEVEHKGRAKLVTACNFPVEDGMRIRTATDQVIAHRRMVAEMLLARCPEVPAIRELANGLGVTEPRFKTADETCILCGLCTRACESFATSAISMLGRGDKKRLDVYTGEPPAGCVGCGGCAIVCPTSHIAGARETAAYRIWDKSFELATCVVNKRLCRGCGACEEACPFSVPRVVVHRAGAATAFIDVAACRGCGVCIAACPTGAIGSPRANRELPVLPATDGRKLLAVACGRANLGGPGSPPLPAGVNALELPCAGGASPAMILGALASGYDGVVVLGRHQASCRLDGAEDHAREVLDRAEQLARLCGLGRGRATFVEPPPGPDGAAQAIEALLAGLEPTPLAEPIPRDQLTDTYDGALAALAWISSRPELTPSADAWLESHGLPAAAPGKPALLAGPIPYLDLLLDEQLAAESLADQLVDGLTVLAALGIDAGVAVDRYHPEYGDLGARLSGADAFTVCPGCAAAARESGLATRSLLELIAEHGAENTNGAPPITVAVGDGEEQIEAAARAIGLELVTVQAPPPIGRRMQITRIEQEALEQRLTSAGEQGAEALLMGCPAMLSQHLIAAREGSWRRSRARPTLIGTLAARRLARGEAER
jgi:ferredoxin